MKDYILVFKTLFRNQNAGRISSTAQRKLSQNVLTLLCMLPLAVLICIVLGFIATIIPDAESLALIVNAVVSCVQMFALFVTMFTVMNTLYNSPDTPFLNTLPVSHTSVFFAKFTIVYLNTLALMASILLPSLLTLAIVYAALGKVMFYGFFALVFVVILVAPILPLFVITLFSMPISYVGTFFKGKAVLKTVLSLLFYILIMVGYLLLVFFLGSGEKQSGIGSVQMGGTAIAGLGIFAKVMYPNKVLINFSLGLNAGVSFGISLAITVGMLGIMILLAMLFYRRINERRLETNKETSHGAVTYKQSNLLTSLMKKDFKNILRNSYLAMSCLANTLLCPIITAVMFFVSDMQNPSEQTPEYLNSMLKLSFVVMYTLIFLGGTNMMAGLAYTRDGRSFYLSKSLPISPRDSIRAKFVLALIPPAAVLLVQIIIAAALYRIDIVNILLFTVCSALVIVGATALHIYCDMRFGNVNWNTRQDLKQASQGNKGSLLVIFGVAAIGVIALVGGMVLSNYAKLLGGEVAVLSIYWSILFALALATCITGLLVLRYKAEAYYDQIGERKFQPKSNRGLFRSGGSNNNTLMK